jgi:AcrR family transcriptional regulator
LIERTGTRERIKQVALELFTEQGYEGTSLREIAERLGVTKAALYYHFKSKEEIVHAFVEDRLDATTQMIAWVRDQPPGEGTRREFIRRYAELIDTGHASSMASFFQQNQPALKNMKIGETMREQMIELVGALAGPGATAVEKLRAGMSVWVLHGAWFLIRDPSVSDEEIRSAALEVALELTQNR